MKKVIGIVTTLIVIVFFILFLFLPKKEFSENENRYFQKISRFNFSNVKTGKFQDSLNNYISDHFPLRDILLGEKNKVIHLLGMYRINGIYYTSDNRLIEEYAYPKNNERIVKVVNKFLKEMNNRKVSFMLAPTAVSIYDSDISKYTLNADENEIIDYYKDSLDADFIDIRKILIDNKDGYIFYNSDHHWTTLGAYYAYIEYCNKNNIEPIDYSFTKVTSDFSGTLYSKVLDNSNKKDYIIKVDDKGSYRVISDGMIQDSLYNDSFLNGKDKYSYFLGGNKGLISIENSDNSVMRNILIIKDSYANCFIPFIVNHYKKIYVVDPRYYKDSIKKIADLNDIDEILFIYNILTIDDDIGILSINR